MEPVPYNNKYFRVLAAFGATLIVLFQDRPFDLRKALTTPMFYPAFVVSFLVALLIVSIIHHIILRLDQSHPWNADIIERFVRQIIMCIVAPLAIDFIVFAIYYIIIGQNIFINRFFPKDFLYVLLLLLFLNAYYWLHAYFYYWRSRIKVKDKSPEVEQRQPANDELKANILPESAGYKKLEIRTHQYNTDNVENLPDHTFSITYRNKKYALNVPHDILYFYRKDKQVRIVTLSNADYPIPGTLGQIINRYEHVGFCQINPSVIINYKIIDGYKDGKRRNTLQLELKSVYIQQGTGLTAEQLKVTKDHITTFYAGWNIFNM